MLIAQGIGLKHLLAVALGLLDDDPYSEGDFYAGDLLMAVLKQIDYVISETPELARQLRSICLLVLNDAKSGLASKDIELVRCALERLQQA